MWDFAYIAHKNQIRLEPRILKRGYEEEYGNSYYGYWEYPSKVDTMYHRPPFLTIEDFFFTKRDFFVQVVYWDRAYNPVVTHDSLDGKRISLWVKLKNFRKQPKMDVDRRIKMLSTNEGDSLDLSVPVRKEKRRAIFTKEMLHQSIVEKYPNEEIEDAFLVNFYLNSKPYEPMDRILLAEYSHDLPDGTLRENFSVCYNYETMTISLDYLQRMKKD